ncbi:cytochrome P450 [Zopfia rhizophila CBS 207.26]|uniref:Cytochrome P450 n=1 Tax=Zopfia rhizophila CBS 207.26 TaxID=1314779 RepID=A0A6A6E6I1_9PEZI|nr:cytochrome P450 [Zopfia rhizophila CBS 207.26]
MGINLNTPWLDLTSPPNHAINPVVYFFLMCLLFLIAYSLQDAGCTNFPIINEKRLLEFSDSRVKNEFVIHGRRMFETAVRSIPGRPFRIFSDSGLMTVLPPEYANEIRNDNRLSFGRHVAKLMMAQYPGFEGFRDGGHDLHVSLDVIKSKLTQNLAKVTEPLSHECEAVLEDIFTDDKGLEKDWHSIILKNCVLQLVARLSSRIFLGEELCRDPAWLRITVDYTVNAFAAAEDLRLWHPLFRPFVHWFLPRCRLLRAQVKEARNAITMLLEKRQAMKATLLRQNKEATEFNDAIEWFQVLAKGRKYDPVNVQLGLSLAAIHTTSDLITQVLLDLAQHPEFVEPLRKEIINVLSEGGWKKTSLYSLKLLDSVIKESQRLKPVGTVSMRREVSSNVTLSDGTVLRRGSNIAVSSHRMWDPTIHTNPLEFDGYRFLKMRQKPGQENTGQLVSTGPDHLAFGHGQHACPGRFFAANEVKIALVHLLMKYDWQLLQGEVPKVREFGFSLISDPIAKLQIRRRQEEISL